MIVWQKLKQTSPGEGNKRRTDPCLKEHSNQNSTRFGSCLEFLTLPIHISRNLKIQIEHGITNLE